MRVKLHERKCPNCGSNDFLKVLESKDFRFDKNKNVFTLVKCKSCDLVYLNPIFSENDLNKFYGTNFYSGYKNYFINKISKIISFLTIKSFFKIFRKYKSKGKVLDVGCGLGGLVSGFVDYKYDAYGIEINKEARQFIKPELRKRIIFNDLKEIGFKKNSFDIITVIHVLEHVYDLKSFLNEIKNNLKKDGILYIRVPNNDFFEYKFFGKYAYNLEVPRHLSFFTKKSLKKVLKNAGFGKIVYIKNNFCELFLTPASFYYSIKYFLKDKNIKLPKFINLILFLLLVPIRMIFKLLFISQQQDIQIIVSLK
jgi:2-polyprenyl-3-methyl-5-hydroxy-6-metoxy-1,4-benzoquinol methylase